MEHIFEMQFNDDCSRELKNATFDSFIEYIDSLKLYFGGGVDDNSIQGGIYSLDKEETTCELNDLKGVLMEFYTQNSNVFSSLKTE